MERAHRLTVGNNRQLIIALPYLVEVVEVKETYRTIISPRNDKFDIFGLSAQEARERLRQNKKNIHRGFDMSLEEKYRLVSNILTQVSVSKTVSPTAARLAPVRHCSIADHTCASQLPSVFVRSSFA
ncbi:unnamed protein product [Strongylus vulgaris]|uniref:Uncharacterized protein n=1 Tax=Strongylus vulgaris TaxID=40348 RepID=A0A3P7IVS8_STRVU|nr:unnamed protein product [Strongylus vulgaris]